MEHQDQESAIGLNRSPTIDKRIKAVQRLAGSNQKDWDYKIEQAQRLRMEILLQNAFLANCMVELLQKSPQTTDEQLRRLAQRKGVVDPQGTEAFVDRVVEAKNHVLNAIKEDPNLKTNIFRDLAKDNARPADGIEIENYPLAIALSVSQKDFKRVDQRKNVAGFFTSDLGSPVTVVVKDYTPLTQPHEEVHAENKIFRDSLSPFKSTCLWGYTELPPAKTLGDILHNSLSRAKDELLAEMKSLDGNPKGHLNNLLEKAGEIYDYFASYLGNHEITTEEYDLLWIEYEKQLKADSRVALEIYGFYRSYFDVWGDRGKLFRWTLAQIPIERWGKNLDPFLKEKKDYMRFERTFGKIRSERLSPVGENDDLPEVEQEILGSAEKVFVLLRQHIFEDCAHKSMTGIIGRAQKQMDALLNQAQNTQTWQQNDRLREFLAHVAQLEDRTLITLKGVSIIKQLNLDNEVRKLRNIRKEISVASFDKVLQSYQCRLGQATQKANRLGFK